MALGRTHDKINIFLGIVAFGTLLNFNHDIEELFLFCVGFIFSTFIFSPDSDIVPKKRSRWMGVFLYPYSLLFKHRGFSHSIWLGTFTRIIYLLVVFFVIYIIFFRMGDVGYHPSDILMGFKNFVTNYNLEGKIYRNITYLFLGMFTADLFHILLDRLTSFVKKLKRLVF